LPALEEAVVAQRASVAAAERLRPEAVVVVAVRA
jgi:hypothetical protein